MNRDILAEGYGISQRWILNVSLSFSLPLIKKKNLLYVARLGYLL